MKHIYKTIGGEFTTEDSVAIKAIQQEIIKSNGFIEINVGKPKRTSKQNRSIHALFRDLAVELEGAGIEYNFGSFSASWTPESAKEFFKQIYCAGKKTSEMNTDDLARSIESLLFDINRIPGCSLSIKTPIKTLSVKKVKDILKN